MSYIAVFCGGFSSEFDVSIKSGKTILNNIPEPYKGILVIVKKGIWEAQIKGKTYPFSKEDCSISLENKRINIVAGIVYVHGDPGENGKIQALLDLNQVPYINSGPLASALSFDKWFCNEFLRGFDIPVAQAILLKKQDKYTSEEIVDKLNLPLFVKPCDSGSSYGISKVKTSDELKRAIDLAFQEGETVLLESNLDGVEVTCALYKGEKGIIKTLPLTEIFTENDFFDFDAKYKGQSQEITPARISEEESHKVEELSKKIYNLLQLGSIARIDFMMVDKEPYVIEVNTTPGFSEQSIIPKMLKVKKQSILDFWKEIISVELEGL